MNYLYSLYDALVSISVPSDKARAVVDAMERDMGTTLATKQDLLRLASKKNLLLFRMEDQGLRQKDIAALPLTLAMIRALHEKIDIPPGLLIREAPARYRVRRAASRPATGSRRRRGK